MLSTRRWIVRAVAAAALGIGALAAVSGVAVGDGHSWSGSTVAGHSWIGGTPDGHDWIGVAPDGHGNPWHG